jgi:hypothetical protein
LFIGLESAVNLGAASHGADATARVPRICFDCLGKYQRAGQTACDHDAGAASAAIAAADAETEPKMPP